MIHAVLGSAVAARAAAGLLRHLANDIVKNEEESCVLDERHHGAGCVDVTEQNRESRPTDDAGEGCDDTCLADAAELTDSEEDAADDHESRNDVCEHARDSRDSGDRVHALRHADEGREIAIVVHAVTREDEAKCDARKP